MDATIAAAWIAAWVGGGVGLMGIVGTVVTSVVSSNNTRKATERTVEASTASTHATLLAAHEAWLRDKECAAYEETLAEVRHRQLKRRHELRGFRWDEASEQRQDEFFSSYQPPNWFQAQARMTAYASEAVLEAFEASERAHLEVWERYQRYRMMADDNKLASETGQFGIAHCGEETIAVRKLVDPAVDAADVADEGLIKLIREGLRSRPDSALQPITAPPAMPSRRLRLRRRALYRQSRSAVATARLASA